MDAVLAVAGEAGAVREGVVAVRAVAGEAVGREPGAVLALRAALLAVAAQSVAEVAEGARAERRVAVAERSDAGQAVRGVVDAQRALDLALDAHKGQSVVEEAALAGARRVVHAVVFHGVAVRAHAVVVEVPDRARAEAQPRVEYQQRRDALVALGCGAVHAPGGRAGRTETLRAVREGLQVVAARAGGDARAAVEQGVVRDAGRALSARRALDAGGHARLVALAAGGVSESGKEVGEQDLAGSSHDRKR